MTVKKATVKKIMTAPVRTAKPNDTVRDAARRLAKDDIGILPVVSDKNEPVGTLTDRDIVLRVVAEGKDASTEVKVAMSRNVVACKADTGLDEAAELMRRHKIRRLMATENGALVGIVSLGDLARQTTDKKLVADTLESVCS